MEKQNDEMRLFRGRSLLEGRECFWDEFCSMGYDTLKAPEYFRKMFAGELYGGLEAVVPYAEAKQVAPWTISRDMKKIADGMTILWFENEDFQWDEEAENLFKMLDANIARRLPKRYMKGKALGQLELLTLFNEWWTRYRDQIRKH